VTPGDAQSSALRVGLVAGVLAYAIWGLFPLYLKQLEGASALEIVAHRIVWSLPFGALILAVARQWRETLNALRSRRVLALIALSSLLIGVNWYFYVWAVANERVLEASLGYYINPLIFIAAGVFVLKERLNALQIAAVGLAAAGVVILIAGAGVFPWPAFVLAASFTSYGYVRKTTPIGAMPGLFIEVALLTPAALAVLLWLDANHALAFRAHGLKLDLLLAFAGPATVAPLAMFALAARRLRLSTLGFLQYIGPTGQFLLGLHYGETFTIAHAFCFGLIWAALALISVDAIRRTRSETAPSVIQSAAATPKSS
jgi:chloramphenicol-sensitive protein RarD